MLWTVSGWYKDEQNEFHFLDKVLMENEELIAFEGSIMYLSHYIVKAPYYEIQMTTGTSYNENTIIPAEEYKI